MLADVFKRGGEIRAEEPAPTRRRPGFSAFVLWPALVFGGVTLVGSFGLITAIFALGVKSGAWDEWGYWRVSLGLSATFAAIISGWVLVMLTNDWRDLQWQYRKLEIEADPPKVLPNDRQIEQTKPGPHVVLQANWIGNWKAELAKRVYRQDGTWKGGEKLTRKILEGDIVRDLNNKYGTVIKADLLRLGWIDEHLTWQDKGKDDLRARVFYG